MSQTYIESSTIQNLDIQTHEEFGLKTATFAYYSKLNHARSGFYADHTKNTCVNVMKDTYNQTLYIKITDASYGRRVAPCPDLAA